MRKPTIKRSATFFHRLLKRPGVAFLSVVLLLGLFPETGCAQQFKKLRPQAYQLPESQVVPPQAKFYAVKSHPTSSLTLYSATAKGLQASDNGGRSWRAIAINGTDGEIFAIAIHPTKPESLLACRRDGLWKTADGGASWSLSATPASVPLSVAFSANQPDIVYLGTAREGIYKSTDGGHQWTQASGGLPEARAGGRPEEIRSLVVDPGNPKVAYAAFSRLGIYRTVDGGTNWEEFNNGIPIAAPIAPPRFSFDPVDPRRLFLALSERLHSHLIRSRLYELKNDYWVPLRARLPANLVVAGLVLDGPRNVLQLWGEDGVWEVPLPAREK